MPDAEKKIVKARVTMLFDHPFFGHLAIGLEPKQKKNMWMPTMATDGRHLFYDEAFVNGLSNEHLMAIICHEVLHCALNHISRCQGRENIRWNLATDFADNDLLSKEFHLPENVLLAGKNPVTITGKGGVSVNTADFEGKPAEEIYAKIPDPEVITISIGTCDSHEEWEDWGKNGKGKKKEKEEGEGGKGESEGSEEGEGEDTLPTMGEDEGEDDDLEQQWRQRVAQAATSARLQGKLPAHLEEIVDGLLQPKLNWKAILRDMIVSCAKSDFRIIPPSKKHLWREIYLPGMYGEEIVIAVAIDTSGSISSEEMLDFLSEVKGICDTYPNYTIYLFTCDAAIQQRWELHEYDPLPTVLAGRGGTNFCPPIEAAEKENLPITSFVYLTDLYGPWPEKPPPFPMVWVATTDVKVPYGYIIRLPRED